MGRARSRSSLVRAWFVALCAACLVAVALPLQLAGATGGGRDPGPGGDPTCLPDDLSCAPGGGGTGSGAAPSSDLSITKTVAGPPPVTGANMLFNIAVENLGPDAASPSGSQPGVTVTDQLPNGLSFVDGGGNGWECTASGQTVTCVSGSLASGAPVNMAIEVAVGADAAPSGLSTMVTNTATVSGLNADPNSANNSSSTTFQVITHTDLSLTKTHAGSFTVGEVGVGTYTFTVHNNGPGVAAPMIAVVDTLPVGFELAPMVGDPNGWECSPGNGSEFACTHSSPLPTGDSPFTVGVLVGGDAAPDGIAAQVTNNARVESQIRDDNDGNNTASDTATVNPSSDLQLTKSHDGNFTHGEHGTYTLSVKSVLGAAAGPITVTDTLPAGWSFVAAESGGNGWSCSVAAGVVTCTHAGTLGNLEETSFPLTADVPSDLAANGPVTRTNTASVASPTPDPASGNNTASDNTNVVDSTPPSVNVPANITKSNDAGLATAVVTYTASSDDNYSGETLSCSPPSGNAFPIGTTTVTCTATDTSGNMTSKAFQVTVNDTEPPSLTVPGNILKSTDPGLPTAVVTYTATAADNVPGVSLDCALPSGAAFPIGPNEVICTAIDIAGNFTSKSFWVAVVDTEPPSITVPADITKSTDPGLATAVVTYTPTAADNAPGVTVACVPPSGTAFAIGTTTVNCTATDGSGNTSSGSFLVNVVDTEPPSLTVPANMTVNATSPSGAVVSFVTTATDNAPGVTKTCTPPSGSTFAIGTTTVSCTATDASSNTTSKSFQITVLGAVDQLNSLINRVKGMTIEPGFKSELLNRLNNGLSALKAKTTAKACSELAKFLEGVNSKSGKKILAGNAATLTSDANRIRAVLAC